MSNDNNNGHTPRCAVVVSSRNRKDKIVALVDSVLRSHEQDFEFVLVDQSDGDESEKVIAPYLEDRRFRYQRSSTRGTCRGRNLAISLTSAPLICITDDDCIVPPEWLTVMMKSFEDDARVGVTFCTVEAMPVPDPTGGMTPQIHIERTKTLTKPEDGWRSAREDGSVLGAGMAVRRTAIQALGGFDDLLGPGGDFPSGEDNDLMWRALSRGWSVHHTNHTSVLHDGFRSYNDLRDLVKRDLWGAGGSMAKFLQARIWGIVPVIWNITRKLGIDGPIEDVRAMRRPRGFKRPYWLGDAIAHGLRIPIDMNTLNYRTKG